ncbi:MAG: rhodanese-like domain-containing protein [Sandaracinaceae bacterium]|nr:rhodanese-like domain-containing protein [Sandaracinaceae bacterium]
MAMVRRVTAEEAEALMRKENFVYVDVRSVPEFEQGHPKGAYNVPLMHMGAGGMEPNGDFVPVMEARFPKDAKLVLGCRSGGRSLRAAELLASHGYTSVIDQRAGWDGARDPFGRVVDAGWSQLKLPTSTDAEPGRSWVELAEANLAGTES